MTLEFHPAVQSDFNSAIAHYESRAGIHVADHFEAEVRAAVAAIQATPGRYPFYDLKRRFRRIRLRRFPYVLVYREGNESIRITILKHERQRAGFGMRRQ